MNYQFRSLFFILFIFSILALYQNCGGGLKHIASSSASNTTKFSVSSSLLKVGDITVEKSRISQQSQTPGQPTTTTTNFSFGSGGINTGSNTNTISYKNISNYQIKPWPNAELIYKFDSSLTNKEKDLFKSACTTWEQETEGLIKCVAIDSKSSLKSGYLLVFLSAGTEKDCFTDLGIASGIGKMVLTEGCANNSKLLHLVGHSLGLVDQHLRPDRNEFVKVPTSGIDSINFIQFQSANYLASTYDFASIMNHPFADSYQPIADKVPQEVSLESIGNIARISESDKALVAEIYSRSTETGGSTAGDGSCSKNQLITWGLGCYYHMPAFTPGKPAETLLAAFNNENTAFETNNRSAARAKCVDGSWQLQTAQCSNLPGVTSGTTVQGCPQTTLTWSGAGSSSLCYLPGSQNLPERSALGSIFEVKNEQNGYPVSFGIFVCEKNPNTQAEAWTFKQSLTYKMPGEAYSQTKNSFCYAKQDTVEQCPVGMNFSWKSTTGNSCNGTLLNPLTIGHNTALYNPAHDSWARVTCIKEAAGTYKLFSDTTGNDLGYCGFSNNTSAPIDLSDGSIVKLAKCAPMQRLIPWRDNFNGEECQESVTITNTYFEGQAYIYQSNINGNSYNSMVALKCIKDTNGAGIWAPVPQTEITAAAGFLPAPTCKKACLPPTQISWENSQGDYTCWGTPDQTRKLIENETTSIIRPTNRASEDSQAEYACSANGSLNLTQNSANKCAY